MSDLKTFESIIHAHGVKGVVRNASLALLSRWQIGGSADIVVMPSSTQEVQIVKRAAAATGVPIFVVGSGSNVLFDSRGYKGVVMKIGSKMGEIRIEGTRVICQAGIWVPFMAMKLARAGLAGLSHVVGIPGTLGGLVLMNGGSQRKGIGANVVEVTCVNSIGEIERFKKTDIYFAYRQSSLQDKGYIVTEVVLDLELDDERKLRREMIEILISRKRRFPKKLPNCGSTFLSNPAMYSSIGPPGKVIEAAGLKGLRVGGAQISPLHANFIVNLGGAKSDEVLALIEYIRRTIYTFTGFKMDCEVRHLTEAGDEAPAHVFTDSGRFDLSLRL